MNRYHVKLEQWYEPHEDISPDHLFDHKTAVTFNSYQTAIQSCLEVLGTRVSPIPVALSILSSPQTIAAVLRSGAHPILLDVEASTLQIQPSQLKEVLDELETVVVVLSQPQGQPVASGLMTLVEDHDLPTIIDTRLPPPAKKKLPQRGLFTVYDLKVLCEGGVVVCPHSQQVSDLRLVRSGLLGHDAALSQMQATSLKFRSHKIASYVLGCEVNAGLYIEKLRKEGKSDMIVFDTPTGCPYFFVKVSDIRKAIAHLDSYGIEAAYGVFSLNNLPGLRDRWQDTPDYPVAKSLENQILAIPCNPGIEAAGHEGSIIDKLLEVA